MIKTKTDLSMVHATHLIRRPQPEPKFCKNQDCRHPKAPLSRYNKDGTCAECHSLMAKEDLRRQERGLR